MVGLTCGVDEALDLLTELARRGVGGFSFQPGRASSVPWSAFGDAQFVLPRFRYAREGGRGWLTVVVRAEEMEGHIAGEADRDGVAETGRLADPEPGDLSNEFGH